MLLQIIVITFIYNCLSLPVTQKPVQSQQDTKDSGLEVVLEYERYLKEVVEALESDPEFRKKLDRAPEVDIRTGRIAQELEYVSHNVRSKLDEIKRREIDRLRSLASKQFDLNNNIDREHLKIPEHLDHRNTYSFEIEDLRKLILQTSKDLNEADKKRREEFKQYEMQKEFEKQIKLKELNEQEKERYEEKLRKQMEMHKKREKLHHPGNKAQLEEVWVKQDHMEDQEFNPEIFFMIHDIDGNGYWDETELKALFVKQLDKAYPKSASEDDLRERAEDMERMREHVFQEVDLNSDGLISFQEFMDQTKREEFQNDSNWQTVDEIPQFTHEEYLNFTQTREKEIQELISQGKIPPHIAKPENTQSKMQPIIGDLKESDHKLNANYEMTGSKIHKDASNTIHKDSYSNLPNANNIDEGKFTQQEVNKLQNAQINMKNNFQKVKPMNSNE